jgi:protoporphyrinogen oxidase
MIDMKAPRIAIVGGGFTGLTAAYRLSGEGAQVTVFEASDTLGGLAAGFELAGCHVEQAYHFLYKTDEYILGLVDELGVRDRLEFHKSSVSTYYGGKLYPMETPIDLIRFTPISFFDRIRAGVTVLWLQRLKNWRSLEDITALEWLRKYAGRRVTDVIWEPLLRGKFDRYYDKVTMSWLWGRVLQRVDSRDKAAGGEVLGYFKGGFRTVLDPLIEKVRRNGGDIRLRAPVGALRHDPETNEVVVTTPAGEERFDRVLVTVPSHITAKMLAGYEAQDPVYFEKLNRIDYLDAAIQVFATRQKVSKYYWHNINSPNSPFVVFLGLTNLVGTEEFDGLNIFYIGDYVPREHKYMQMEEGDLKDLWYAKLKEIFPDFDRDQVVDDRVFRLRNAQHIVDIGFEREKLVPHETPCPGVFMCNFSQIYPMDRGTNYAVRDGMRMAKLITESLAQGYRGSAPAEATQDVEPSVGEGARRNVA